MTVKELKQTIREASIKIAEIQMNCKHELRSLTESELEDEWMTVSATCIKCETHFGWRCKLSPDGVCHSREDELSINGEKLTPPNESLGYEGDCVYCGLPDERK